MLNVCEIFTSIQGESTLAGYLCAFVRLARCNLRCVWCDTVYSHGIDAGTFGVGGGTFGMDAGTLMSVGDIVGKIAESSADLVEITGGEPLLQPEVIPLCGELLSRNYRVMMETNGSQDIGTVPAGVSRIVDIKCPGSGSHGSFLIGNLEYITSKDEIKFVIASIDDAVWARKFCIDHRLRDICPVTFSPVGSLMPYNKLADWMVENRLAGIRLGLQIHKIIWGDRRGV